MKNYTTPIFVPIKLDGAAGTPGGCKQFVNSTDFNCLPHMDYNGKEVFANSNNGCARIVENIGEVCYEIPLVDRNVYAS